jgi:UDP-glucose 4-epimerase
MRPRILMTGSSGFVGRSLAVDLLAAGCELVTLGRKGSGLAGVVNIDANLGDPALLRSALGALRSGPPFDQIIHLAVSRHHREFPEKALDLFYVNTGSVAELLDFARQTGVRNAVFGSTGTVYGLAHEPGSDNAGGNLENEFARPPHYFAATKLFADTFCEYYRSSFNIATLRLYAPYGPGLADRMLTDLVGRVKEGRPLTLPTHGPGLSFACTHLSDVKATIRRALDEGWNETVNVAGPDVLSIETVGHLIGKVLGKEPQFERSAAINSPRLVPDLARLNRLMTGHVFVNAVQGITEMITADVHGGSI